MAKSKTISNRTYYYEGEYYSKEEAWKKAKTLKKEMNGHGKGLKYLIEGRDTILWGWLWQLWTTSQVTLFINEKH